MSKDPFEMPNARLDKYKKIANNHQLNLDLFLIQDKVKFQEQLEEDSDELKKKVEEEETTTVNPTDLWKACRKIKKAAGISTAQAMDYFIQAAEMLDVDLNDLSD